MRKFPFLREKKETMNDCEVGLMRMESVLFLSLSLSSLFPPSHIILYLYFFTLVSFTFWSSWSSCFFRSRMGLLHYVKMYDEDYCTKLMACHVLANTKKCIEKWEWFEKEKKMEGRNEGIRCGASQVKAVLPLLLSYRLVGIQRVVIQGRLKCFLNRL